MLLRTLYERQWKIPEQSYMIDWNSKEALVEIFHLLELISSADHNARISPKYLDKYFELSQTLKDPELIPKSEEEFLIEVILEYCRDCLKMPSLPQSAFAVHKIREKHEYFTMTKKPTGFGTDDKRPPKKQFGTQGQIVQLAPVKYNEKLMNSIWGLYNRNSPHNFKKNNAAGDGLEGQQQFVAASGAALAAAATHPPNPTTKTIIDANGNAALTINFPRTPSDNHLLAQDNHQYNTGPFAGHTHSHGHHGNWHNKHHHQSPAGRDHFEEIMAFTAA